MKAILMAKRFQDTGFSIDVEFQHDSGVPITTKTLTFSGAQSSLSMNDVKARVLTEAERLQVILALNSEPDAALNTDLLEP